MARKSSVVFACGNGSLGTDTPSLAQIGPQPSPGCHSISRSAGIVARTSALCLSYAALHESGFLQSGVNRSSIMRSGIGESPLGASRTITSRIVLLKLLNHCSVLARVDNSTGASGYLSASSRQNAAAGQSTDATQPVMMSSQSALPSIASINCGTLTS